MAETPSAQQKSEALLPVYKRFPIEIVRGEGTRLFGADGRSYLDFTSGIGVNALGYADAGIAEAARGGCHGRLFATLAATDRPQYRAPFRPLAGGISIAERDLGELARMMDRRTVAAVIVEPVQGEGGVRVLEPAFLRGLRELTRERNVALIFDEVQCGLGRTGWLFAYERTD